MSTIKKILVAAVAWLVIIKAMLASTAVAIGAALMGRMTYAANVVRAQDRVLAAMMGWSGKRTISAECHGSDCRFCKWLCGFLNKFWPDHCAEADKQEPT